MLNFLRNIKNYFKKTLDSVFVPAVRGDKQTAKKNFASIIFGILL